MLPGHTISIHPYQLNQDTTYSISLGNELSLSKGVVLETLFLKATKFFNRGFLVTLRHSDPIETGYSTLCEVRTAYSWWHWWRWDSLSTVYTSDTDTRCSNWDQGWKNTQVVREHVRELVLVREREQNTSKIVFDFREQEQNENQKNKRVLSSLIPRGLSTIMNFRERTHAL